MNFHAGYIQLHPERDKFANTLINIPKIAKCEVVVMGKRSAPLMGLKQADEILTMLKPLAELVQLRCVGFLTSPGHRQKSSKGFPSLQRCQSVFSP